MKLLAFLLGVWICLTGSSLDAAVRGVSVNVTPAVIVRKTFDPRHPPAGMPKLTPPEIGQCVYEFACEMETRVEQPALPLGRPPARVIATSLTTRLTITLWTPQAGPPAILEHEEGHREICEIYYRPAYSIARRLGEEVLGTTLSVPRRDQAALQTALRELQDKVIKTYLRETLTRCSYAQQRFDAITQHSRAKVPVRVAIQQALAEEAAFHRAPSLAAPAATPRRLPPTRPRPGYNTR